MAISVDKAVIARVTKSGEKFEILVDPEKALDLRRGKAVALEDLLAAKEIFEDAKKGLRAGQDKLNKAFGTNNIEEVVKKIIFSGEIQLTTEQRHKMLEDRKKQIATAISRRGINPQTGVPHPVERVLHAIEQAKYNIDINKSAEEQIEDVLKKIQPIIPIRFEKIQIAVKIPVAHAVRAPSVVRGLGVLQKEEWSGDGSYICVMEIPAGLQTEVYEKLNSLAHGEAEVKILKKESY